MFGYNTKEEVLSLDLVRDGMRILMIERNTCMLMSREVLNMKLLSRRRMGNKMITRCSLTVVKDKGVINTYRA